jgi:hypothetical protein
VLYSFCAGSNTTCQDGGGPAGQLIFDASGNLYGTTTRGGLGGGSGRAGGTVSELSPSLSGWTHTILYNFCVNGNVRICPDGDQPEAGVTFYKAGNLYGTTMSGGTKNSQVLEQSLKFPQDRMDGRTRRWSHLIRSAFWRYRWEQ